MTQVRIDEWLGRKNKLFSLLCSERVTNNEVVVTTLVVIGMLVVIGLLGRLDA